MILLAIDTAASLCAACVFDTARGELGRCVLDLGKGHAERMIEVIDEALAAAGCVYADLGAIAVSVGPGSFTGVRVGVAAARGLALALRLPALGVSTLEALAFEARRGFPDVPVLVALEAGREQIYVAGYAADGTERQPPAVLPFDDAVRLAASERWVLTGSAAAKLREAARLDLALPSEAATADIATFAAIAGSRLAGPNRDAPQPKPVPLYLRGADAKPQEGFALPRTGLP